MDRPRRLESQDVAALDHIQRLAILEALVTSALADGTLGATETADLERELAELSWGIDEPELVALLRGATSYVASLRVPQQLNDFVVGVALRLPAPELRDKVFFTMAARAVAVAGGRLDRLDGSVLVAFVIAFGISAERLGLMRAELGGNAPA